MVILVGTPNQELPELVNKILRGREFPESQGTETRAKEIRVHFPSVSNSSRFAWAALTFKARLVGLMDLVPCAMATYCNQFEEKPSCWVQVLCTSAHIKKKKLQMFIPG